ncbi:MAG: hypothetical protein JJU05_04025 [Verrucomicrobia bacterium]|nr:hypothetical protein [Verrucomicrobiota bacterium]
MTVLLLFRPDEELEAGEDAAAYFNAAQQYLRTGALHLSDPALAELRPEDRPLFRYGDHRFMITKDHTLWARDLGMDPVSVFFFPAYSFLLGFPMMLGFPYGAFWLSSLVAVGCGVLLAGLAVKLTGRGWAGWLTYGLFLLHPAVAWNARALRAEWPASLLVLCGLVLWLPVVLEKRAASWSNGLLAGLALSGAVLFHMTAVYVVIPALIAGIILTRRDCFWAGWWTGLAAGFALFAAQTVWVTDPYWIADNLMAPGRRGLLLSGLGALMVFSFGARWIYHRFSRFKAVQLGMGLLMSLAVLAVVLLTLRFRDEHGHIPLLPAWTVAYISLTDFQGVLRTMSRVWFLFALMGLPVLCLRSALGRWIFFLLAPASMTIGWVVNYMFETRRMVTFLVPLLILGTVSLLDWGVHAAARRLPVRNALKTRAPAFGAVWVSLMLAAFAVRGRTQIYSTWNLKGIHGFYRTLSARIQPEADFLFAEYTQTAVPIEKMTGLPLLPLAWEYRSEDEIERIQSIWRDTVSDHPERRHVLISPFAGSAIPGVAMEPLWTESVRTKTLGRARRDVPQPVHRWTRTLHAHRLLPPGEVAPRIPYVREFHGSRLGIQGGANRMGPRATELRGNRLDTDEPVRIPWGDTQEFVLLIAYPHGVPGALPEINGGTVHRVKMGRHWEALWVQAEGSDVLSMRSEHFSFLVQLFERQGSTLNPAVLPAEAVSFGIDDLDSQWVRAEAALLVPEHPGLSWIWIYAQHSRSDPEPVRVTLFKEDGSTLGDLSVTAEWAWHPVAVEHPEDARGVFAWMKLQTLPAYDPGLSNFPSDLGIRMHQFVVDPQP